MFELRKYQDGIDSYEASNVCLAGSFPAPATSFCKRPVSRRERSHLRTKGTMDRSRPRV